MKGPDRVKQSRNVTCRSVGDDCCAGAAFREISMLHCCAIGTLGIGVCAGAWKPRFPGKSQLTLRDAAQNMLKT